MSVDKTTPGTMAFELLDRLEVDNYRTLLEIVDKEGAA